MNSTSNTFTDRRLAQVSRGLLRALVDLLVEIVLSSKPVGRSLIHFSYFWIFTEFLLQAWHCAGCWG